MASNTDIANMALSHLGIGKEIANLETEIGSQEAAACRRFFDTARNATLRDFQWPFANKYMSLALVVEEPNDDWNFSYRYPTDCLNIQKILSGIRVDSRQSRVPFELARDSAGRLIFTDMGDAQIKYTSKAEDPIHYPDDFVMALSFRLAAYIAPRLTGGDPFKMGIRALEMYRAELSAAAASARNEGQADQEPESEFIRIRDGSLNGELDGFEPF